MNDVRSCQAQNGSIKEPEMRFPHTCSTSMGCRKIYGEPNRDENLKPLAYCRLNESLLYFSWGQDKNSSLSNAPVTEVECPSYRNDRIMGNVAEEKGHAAR